MRRIGCLLVRERAVRDTRAAQQTLLEVALAHSPWVEEAGPGLVYLDVAGLQGLHGDEGQLGQCLRDCAEHRGLQARVGIAGSRIGALHAALQGPGVTVVPPGDETPHLSSAPLSLLDLSEELRAQLSRWGIRTLGELAALPTASLFERLGSEGVRVQQVARGEDPRPLQTRQPPPTFEESVELDWAMDTLEPLVALLTALAERICTRLARRGLAADAFEWVCRLSDRTHAGGDLTPAFPMNEISAVKPLLRASLESKRPGGAVEAVTLRARPVRVTHEQDSFGDPPRPSPRILTAALARLAAVAGAARIGVPRLLDTHRPDALRLEPFRLTAPSLHALPLHAVLALRRRRPPCPAIVRVADGRPAHLESDRLAGPIVAGTGPWRTSGDWWTERRWAHDEWDVELAQGPVCRLTHDGSIWFVEGIYD